MRIISRAEFMKLPSGAICCEGEPWVFGEWFRKDGNCGDTDYLCTSLDWTQFDNNGSEDMWEKAEAARKHGTSLPLIFDGCGRDGCFVHDATYCVLEDGDLDALVSILLAAKGKVVTDEAVHAQKA